MTEVQQDTWVVYVVECRDGTLYTGVARDLAARLRAHNAGKGARYTRGRRPVALRYWEPHATRGEAQRREAEIRRRPRGWKERLFPDPC